MKIPARGLQTGFNMIGDTFKGIKKKKWKTNPLKWQWNPFKWKFKNFDYSDTKRSWKKFSSWDTSKSKEK